MTKMAMPSSMPSPLSDCWKACALPWKLVEMVMGRVFAAKRVISFTASPMATPGCKLNEMVTEGSCPMWFTVSGPRLVTSLATVLSDTSCPLAQRMYK
jgi:hypothetical protein